MTLSNLPPGTTDRMIEEQANGCSTCEKCGHEDVEITGTGDIEVHGYMSASISVDGTCVGCGAEMEGKGTPTGEGGREITDIEWEVKDCSHGEQPEPEPSEDI